jgi:DNA mismatch repair protein MutS
VLDQLENADRAKPVHAMIDDLPLFSATIAAPPIQRAEASPALEALRALNPDELSPREALQKLYELRAMAGVSSSDGKA